MEIIGPVSLYIIIVLGVVGGLACLIDKNAQCHDSGGCDESGQAKKTWS